MKSRANLSDWVLVLMLLLAKMGTTKARTIYVDCSTPGLTHDGSSWANAYNYLQDALADANSSGDVNEIWVAEGIYRSDEDTVSPNGTGDLTATFQLINRVAICGGYAGHGAADPNERNIELYETVLSGDLGGNDTPGLDPCDLMNDRNRWENSYHVVTGSGTDTTAALDGFTIKDGFASGSEQYGRGGGMYNFSGSPTLTNCTFHGNWARSSGGGMWNYSNSSPILTNCTFSGNSAYKGGGMSAMEGSSPTLTSCTFSGNVAIFAGGGMHNYRDSIPTLTSCSFSGNLGNYGGGVYNYRGSSPTVTNCTFSGNLANYGGGMCNEFGSDPNIVNCTFTGNSATYYGGGIDNWDSSPTATNCILWGNSTRQIDDVGTSSTTVNYSDIQDGYPGTGNINADPLFVDSNGPDDIAGTEDDNLRLSTGSPCIDAGDNDSVPQDTADLDGDGDTTEPIPWDLDGKPRIVDGNSDDEAVVDMGAYEYVPSVPPITLTITAPCDTNIAQGGILGPIEHAVTNTSDTAYAFLARRYVIAPGGFTKYWPVVAGEVPAETTIYRTSFLPIPTWAPVGTYTYGLELWDSPGSFIDSNSFEFTVEESPKVENSASQQRTVRKLKELLDTPGAQIEETNGWQVITLPANRQ